MSYRWPMAVPGRVSLLSFLSVCEPPEVCLGEAENQRRDRARVNRYQDYTPGLVACWFATSLRRHAGTLPTQRRFEATISLAVLSDAPRFPYFHIQRATVLRHPMQQTVSHQTEAVADLRCPCRRCLRLGQRPGGHRLDGVRDPVGGQLIH